MRQGEIYWADLEPIVGNEQGGKRPVVVISGNTMNKNLKVGIVCPLTSQQKNYPGCVKVKKNFTNGLHCDSEVVVFQTRTISSKRLEAKIGKLNKSDLFKVLSVLGELLRY
jgi:mRNA interferase MazF